MILEKIGKTDIQKITEFISGELQDFGKIRKEVVVDFLLEKYGLTNLEASSLLESIENGLDKSSENEILTLSSGQFLKKEDICRLSVLLSGDNDWQYLSGVSLRHGVEPLLYKHIKNIPDCNIPPDIYQSLKNSYEKNLLRNESILKQLSEILKMLKGRGVEVILLKGSALLKTVYRNDALRPMRDVDLLVKKDDLSIVENLFHLEYEDKERVFPSQLHGEYAVKRDEEFVRNFGGGETHSRIYANGEKFCDEGNNSFVIDFHWDYITPFGPSPEQIAEIWNRRREVDVNGIKTSVFSPEDMILHLCLHLNNHINKRHQKLIWWCDIAETVRMYNSEINWEIILENIKISSRKEHIPFILNTLVELFNSNIPAEVLKEYSFEKDRIRAREIINFDSAFVKVEDEVLPERGVIEEVDYLEMIKYIKGFRNKIKYVWDDIFPSKKYMKRRYITESEGVLYLFYIKRLITALISGLKLCTGMLRRGFDGPAIHKEKKTRSLH